MSWSYQARRNDVNARGSGAVYWAGFTQREPVLRSDQFHHRIDALNHFLDGAYRAVLDRLVFDNQTSAMIKTITFSATLEELRPWLERLEGVLRREVAALEESASFQGRSGDRYTLGITLAPGKTEDSER